MRTVQMLAAAVLGASGCAGDVGTPVSPRDASQRIVQPVRRTHVGIFDVAYTKLYSRHKYGDYFRAVFSFEHGVGDDPGLTLTHNDWDIEYGNGPDAFGVTMVVDDRSRILDLGVRDWTDIRLADLPVLKPFDTLTRELAPAVVDHMYLVHTKDTDTDAYSLFKVEALREGDSVIISWAFLGMPDEIRSRE